MLAAVRRRYGIGAAIGFLLACAPAPASASALAPLTPPGIKALGTYGSVKGRLLGTFRSLSCRVSSTGFRASGRVGDWNLLVTIKAFTGFHRYSLRYGQRDPYFGVYQTTQGAAFTNVWTPPFPLPPIGGGISFIGGRGVIHAGFPAAYDSSDSQPDRIYVVGRAACRYPPPPRR